MDLATILAVLVAGIIVLSGYFLFNGAPSLKDRTTPRRSTRRT